MLFSSIGVSKRGLLAKRLMIAMRTEFKMTLRILLHCKKVGLVSFFLKILGRNQDFSKVLSRGSHFSMWLGRKCLGEEFEFSDICLGGSLLRIYNVCRHFSHENFKIFFNHGGLRRKFPFTNALAS